MKEPVLTLKDIKQHFGRNGDPKYIIKALDGLDLDVGRGDFIIVIGENGSGKSSLLNAIYSGTHTSGTIILNGQNITRTPEHIRSKNMGLITQQPAKGSVDEFSILENIMLSTLKQHKPSFKKAVTRDLEHKYREIFDTFNMHLLDRLHQPVSNLSGGERQLICVLMSLIGSPSILLCDEPTASIDASNCIIVENMIKTYWAQEGIPVIWITHDKRQAARLGNRLIVFGEGKIRNQFNEHEKSILTDSEIGALMLGDNI